MNRAVFLLVILGLFVFGSGVRAEQKVVFLDVGQGDAILLQDGSRQVLIDGGPGMKVDYSFGLWHSWLSHHPKKNLTISRPLCTNLQLFLNQETLTLRLRSG